MHPRQLIHPADGWLDEPDAARMARVALIAVLGLCVYGFTVGYWRDPQMGVYVAVKLPLLVAITLLCNALLNGLLGLLLGSGLGFRQSFFALLSAFALAGLILGSLAPVTLLMAWNAPSPDSPYAGGSHSAYMVGHTFLIGFAGIAANLHLHRQLLARSPGPGVASATLLAWLGGNAFLGAQFSWIMRPFFGAPGMKVQFLRDNPLQGNFYQTIWRSIEHITGGFGVPALAVIVLVLMIPVARAIHSHQYPKPQP
jgi:hypothetical protein